MIINSVSTFNCSAEYSFVVNNCSEVMYVDIDLIDSLDDGNNVPLHPACY